MSLFDFAVVLVPIGLLVGLMFGYPAARQAGIGTGTATGVGAGLVFWPGMVVAAPLLVKLGARLRLGFRATFAVVLMSSGGLGLISMLSFGPVVRLSTGAVPGFAAGAGAGLAYGLFGGLVAGFAVGNLRAGPRTTIGGESRARRAGQIVALRLADLAVVVAGASRAWRAEEFRANLAPRATDGERSGGAPVRHAVGLLRWAVVARLRDLTRLLSPVLDWMLAKPRTEYLAALVTVATGGYFLVTSGFAGLLHDLDNVAAAFFLLYGAGVFLRTQREVPPAPPRHHGREQELP